MFNDSGARCSSVVRAFAHGAIGRWIDPSWGGPIDPLNAIMYYKFLRSYLFFKFHR